MKAIDQDLCKRQPVWEALSTLFLDTSLSAELPRIAKVCAESPYSIPELRTILFSEVFPACRTNLSPSLWPGGEWSGFDPDWLRDRIREKHRHGKRPLVSGWLHTSYGWARLKPRILALRTAGSS
jgi:hypothetical protein